MPTKPQGPTKRNSFLGKAISTESTQQKVISQMPTKRNIFPEKHLNRIEAYENHE
jgi:hypothetical protein